MTTSESTTAFHHTFDPWRVRDDKRIVAGDRKWKELAKMNRETETDPEVCRVLIGEKCDPFEDWAGPMVGAKGNRVGVIRGHKHSFPDGEWFTINKDAISRKDGEYWLEIPDVRRRLFDIIDRNWNLTYCLLTDKPEGIARLMPPTPVYNSKTTGEILPYWGPNQTPRPNLWLGARIRTQAEADARIPHLLRVPAALRWLHVNPKERINLLGRPDCGQEFGPCWVNRPYYMDTEYGPELQDSIESGIGWIVVEGGDEPIHPDNVRYLRDQCRDAGVPFTFLSWGRWGDPESIEATGLAHNGWHEDDPEDGGVPRHSWPGKHPSNPIEVFRVGRKASGRILDGRTHDEVPELDGKGVR